MSQYRLTPVASRDLDGIADYIAKDSKAAAFRVLVAIEEACELLAEFPHLGPRCDDLRRGMRFFVEGSYVIFYHPSRDGIEVLRVLHGARDFPTIFGPG